MLFKPAEKHSKYFVNPVSFNNIKKNNSSSKIKSFADILNHSNHNPINNLSYNRNRGYKKYAKNLQSSNGFEQYKKHIKKKIVAEKKLPVDNLVKTVISQKVDLNTPTKSERLSENNNKKRLLKTFTDKKDVIKQQKKVRKGAISRRAHIKRKLRQRKKSKISEIKRVIQKRFNVSNPKRGILYITNFRKNTFIVMSKIIPNRIKNIFGKIVKRFQHPVVKVISIGQLKLYHGKAKRSTVALKGLALNISLGFTVLTTHSRYNLSD